MEHVTTIKRKSGAVFYLDHSSFDIQLFNKLIRKSFKSGLHWTHKIIFNLLLFFSFELKQIDEFALTLDVGSDFRLERYFFCLIIKVEKERPTCSNRSSISDMTVNS